MKQNHEYLEQISTELTDVHFYFQKKAWIEMNRNMLIRNWLIGREIYTFEKTDAGKIMDKNDTLARLAALFKSKGVKDLGRPELLTLCRNFFLIYPQLAQIIPLKNQGKQSAVSSEPATPANEKAAPSTRQNHLGEKTTLLHLDPEELIQHLSFSHLEILMDITQAKLRHFYEIETIVHGWNARQLRQKISKGVHYEKDR